MKDRLLIQSIVRLDQRLIASIYSQLGGELIYKLNHMWQSQEQLINQLRMHPIKGEIVATWRQR